MDITLQYFDGCPNWQTTDERLRALAVELDFQITYRQVASAEDTEALSFRGSPTILVDGRDPFTRGDEPAGLACRVYATPLGRAGAPTVTQLRALG
ncbi:MAG: thioredoxin family protein [Jiangellaceae bacterium]